ncbi:MAG TPA: helix-turn-helix transcriptional regulator [Mycobacteriales bacterium]|nr:helix-turn-helix transcriptional regulator [Mycobacteriales bacterium]
MATRRQPTLRAQWLGAQLKDLRTTTGMTLDDAAEYLQRNAGTISRFESAEYPIRRGDLLALLDLYKVSQGRKRRELLHLAEEVWRKGWWDGYADAVDQQFVDYVWLEQRARRICSYDAMIVPGLAQTREYAESLIRNAADTGTTDEQIDRWIELRLARQRVLHTVDAPDLSIVLDESTLHRPIGSRKILRAQLTHLLDLAGQPSVQIQVLPLTCGAHAGLDGMFMVFERSEPYPDVAYVETLAGRLYVESPETERFARSYDRLRAAALGVAQSVKLISAAAKEKS